MNLYDKFSTRQAIEPEEAEIVVREDAPAELRSAFVQIAYDGLSPAQPTANPGYYETSSTGPWRPKEVHRDAQILGDLLWTLAAERLVGEAADTRVEPSRPLSYAMMSLRRAAHSESVGVDEGTSANEDDRVK